MTKTQQSTTAAGKGKQGDRRHDDGNGRHDDSKGQHGDGKRQQGDRWYDDGDGRHDDGKGLQGVRRHDQMGNVANRWVLYQQFTYGGEEEEDDEHPRPMDRCRRGGAHGAEERAQRWEPQAPVSGAQRFLF